MTEVRHAGRQYKSLAAAARKARKSYYIVYQRVHVLGWSLRRALSTPVREYAR